MMMMMMIVIRLMVDDSDAVRIDIYFFFSG